MDPERKRALKKKGKAEVARRSAELQAALSASNPALLGSDEWMANHTLATIRERWLQRRRPLLHAKQLHAMFVVQPYESAGWVAHPGAYVLCTTCGSAVPCAVPNRLLYWRSCSCGNIGWRAVFGWTTLIVHQPDALVPVKLIGRGESSPAEVPEPVKPPARPPARFSIRPLKRAKRPGANEYEVFDGDTLVARYWHDFRGEEHGIIFVDGRRDDWPVDRNGDFVVSAGPFLLAPSQAAVAYLTRMLGPS